jgi:hypothetical protein
MTTASCVELLSGPIGFGVKLHDPEKSWLLLQLTLTVPSYVAPTGNMVRLKVADCPALMVWFEGEKLPSV